MARRYHLAPLPPPGRTLLPPEVGHHLGRVLRARVGDPVVLFDGAGWECTGRIEAIAGSGHRPAVTVELAAAIPSPREPRARVEVAFATPKGNRGEWLFEHGTEVGVAVFHPLRTARAVAPDRVARWQRILVAATGQCDRGRIPRLREPRPLAGFLADPELPAERYLADPDGPALAAAETDAAVLLVGPEGGLTAVEVAAARAHGFAPRRLGVTTLRTETAVVAGAVLLLQGHGSAGIG